MNKLALGFIVFTLTLLWSCGPDLMTLGPDATPSPRPAYKYHFGDKVIVNSEFYGSCVAKVENPPWWSEACAVDRVPEADYVYVFSRMKCRSGAVNYPGGILTRCERALIPRKKK